jgi:hypothetical protein
MKTALKKLALIGIITFILAATAVANAAIAVVPQPGISDDVRLKVAKTVGQFNDILEREMKVRLTRDITIHLCPSTEAYRQTLETVIGMSPALAQSSAKVSSGLANSTHNAIALKFNPENAATFDYRAYTVTAHELFHQVQYQLAGNSPDNTQKWLREGSADLVGAIIAEKLGYESLDKWRADRLNALRRAKAAVKPADILHVSLSKWNSYVEDGLLPYQVSDLMVFYLMNRSGNNLEAIATYFTLAGSSRDDDRNFRQAFGLSLGEFLPAFESWLAGILAEAAKIDVISEGGGDAVGKIRKVAEASKEYFQENFGASLRANVRIVVAADRTAYAAALAREFGIDAQEAEKRAKSTWWFINSTTVVNTSAFSSESEMAYLMADSLARRLAHEAASQPLLESVYWLYYGGAKIIGLKIAENLGYAAVRQYPDRWRADLIKHPRPTLSEITGKAAWEQAVAKYGRATVERTARLAALFLIEKHGVQPIYSWYLRTKETKNAGQAFGEIFGLSPEALEKGFDDYLNAKKEQAALPAPFYRLPAA